VKTRRLFRLTLQALTVLSLAAIFVSLGFWQLDRARELQSSKSEPVLIDQRVYELRDLTTPTSTLPLEAFGKSVAVTGHYIATYKAPNQVDREGKRSDWEVALMQVDTSTAILVVRGLWADRLTSPDVVMATNLSMTGTLYPRQGQDRAEQSASQLSRIDSALLTGATDLQLYDGFISATSESYRGGQVERSRIFLAITESGIPGYYWQHISYVAIWWVMAALVLWAPFYRRRERLESAL
jgi:cytochrome oxidase assembly protein ShyY1